uniref:Uncharacterized protein n=1 Tax=Neogobius melanostomus TaxID=47308 RepID=A0A8C6TK49_9GOBI
ASESSSSPRLRSRTSRCPCREELLVLVAGLHESTSPSTPALIIVDGLEGYLCNPTPSSSSGLHTSVQSSAAHLSALLCDTSSFLSQVLEKQGTGAMTQHQVGSRRFGTSICPV